MRAERPAGGARILAMSLNESRAIVEGLGESRASPSGWSYVIGSVVDVGWGSGFTDPVIGDIGTARPPARRALGRRVCAALGPSIDARVKVGRTTAIRSG
jgi:hypothetical protein